MSAAVSAQGSPDGSASKAAQTRRNRQVAGRKAAARNARYDGDAGRANPDLRADAAEIRSEQA